MRKLLSCLMALILLMLPTAGLAASSNSLFVKAAEDGRTVRGDITFTPGVLPVDGEIATAISDLLKSLSVTMEEASNDEGAYQRYVIGLGGKDVLTMTTQQVGDLYYAESSLWDDTIAYNREEYQTIMNRADVLLAKELNMPQKDIDAMVEAMEEAQANPPVAEGLQEFTLDTTKLEPLVRRLYDAAKEESYTGASKNHDAATRKLTMTVTAADVAEFMEIVCDQLRANEGFMTVMGLAIDGTNVAGATNAKKLMTELPARYEEALSQCEDIVVTALLAENGELVHMDFALVPKEEELTRNTSVTGVDFVYNRLTTTDGVGHSMEYTIDAEGDKIAISLNALTGSEKRTALSAAITYLDEKGTLYDMLTLTVDGAKELAEDATKHSVTVELAVRENPRDDAPTYGARIDWISETAVEGKDVVGHATATLTLLGEKEPMLTVNFDRTTVDGFEPIATDKADRPGLMSDKEFTTYMNKVKASILTNVMTILQNLPDSALRMLLRVGGL